MRDGLILALDGSTDVCSAALLRDGGRKSVAGPMVVTSRSVAGGRGQAKVLLGLVDEMLEELGATQGRLSRVVVGTGPGTFTGVRIAVATARGIALGLSIPVYGVSTLAALAAGAVGSASAEESRRWTKLVALIDARRGQVFCAMYEALEEPGSRGSGDVRWGMRTPIAVCERGSVRDVLGGAGDGVVVVVGADEELAGVLPGSAVFLKREVEAGYLVSGSELFADDAGGSDAGGADGKAGLLGEPESVRPIYVRAPDADIHITKMKDPWGGDASER